MRLRASVCVRLRRVIPDCFRISRRSASTGSRRELRNFFTFRFIIMKNAVIIIILAIVSNLLEYGYGQISKCGIERFRCKDGQCIANELLCDGRADCTDGSDETVAECTKPEITCPDYAFRCSYGGCVDGDATCNGIRDCVDNSDETLSRCRDRGNNESTTCSPNQFLCDNKQCIPGSSLCDGTADCADKSDETFIQCGSITCPQLVFRCTYGACIDGDLKCNGAVDCADGSDEDPRLCRDITVTSVPDTTSATTLTTSTARTPSPRQPCIAPPQPKNGWWKLHKSQCASGEHCDVQEGVQMEPGTYLVYNCNTGYKIRGSADVVCGPGRIWLNIPVCTEIRCRPLQSASTSAVCLYDDEDVSCQSPVLPRTVAVLTCRTSYRQDTALLSRSTVKCNKTGQWDPEPIRCIPVCGVTPPNNVPLIVHGTRPKISEFPWHATLYRVEKPGETKEFICGATIIQERLLVTAAHCVYNEVNKRLEDPSKFFIATGNIYRDYDSPFHNSITVKKAKVKNMYVVCNYLGLEGNYAGDIAILEVTEAFIFSSLLLPICMDISNDQIILESGVFGKVAGFGRTAVGASSYILQSITVPYIPLNQCKTSSMPYETERYITFDKFCAGYTNGTSVCDGDSGGGLAFRRGNLWYLKGIVSVSLGTTTTGAGRICDNLQYGYGQINKCGWERFQCKNGQCIANELLCDGRADCTDQSDETVTECNNTDIICADFAFRCSYGGCIDGDKTCNGIRDCVDNSDETLSRCRDTGSNGSTTCSPNQFLCDNRECIPGSSLCDGTADCADSSDETSVQCESIMCPELLFRCNYGGCIDGKLKCNGAMDCVDGSDEDRSLCRDITVTAVPDRISIPPNIWAQNSKQSCLTPPQPKNGFWKLHKLHCASEEHCDVSQGVEVDPGTSLVYDCDPGYKIRGSPNVICGVGRTWFDIPVCTEIRCRPLQSTSTNAVCRYDDQDVSCQYPALPGTVARLTCRPGYRPYTSIFYTSIVKCNKTGLWNPGPIPCLPECGLVPPESTPLIVQGTQAKISQFPWHATLYRAEKPGDTKKFICGATIIQNTLLVTAAHCVFNEATKRLEDPSKFFIAAGNIYRDYDSPHHNSLIVKKAEVKNMYVVCNYYGLEGNYAGDIAILEIKEPFVFSSLILPICLDISKDQIILESGITGKVAGFGRTSVGASSYVLQSITVPYVPMNQCKISSKPYETEKFLTFDKFCAGYTNGSSVCDGDSGGGLVFSKGKMWYLQGIVSVSLGATTTGAGKICDSNSYSLYTQVSYHMSWIQEVILRLAVHKSYPSCPLI